MCPNNEDLFGKNIILPNEVLSLKLLFFCGILLAESIEGKERIYLVHISVMSAMRPRLSCHNTHIVGKMAKSVKP